MTLADRWLLPDGMKEMLPPRARQVEMMRRRLLDLYHCWGYDLVMPPLAEHLESLLTGVGRDLELKTFKLTDQVSGHTLGVRADITPQVARIDAHRLRTEGPSRLCYCGSVLHTRPGHKLASRNPLQLGAELYGHAGVDSDVEVISLMLETLDAVGVRGPISLDLGHVGVFSQLMSDAELTAEQQDDFLDMLQRKALPEIARFVEALALAPALSERLLALPRMSGGIEVLAQARALFAGSASISAALDYLERVAERVAARYPQTDLYFDLGELRGYHYHTGIVFAAYTPHFGQALAKGGRYDEIGRDFGRARPATGFSSDLKTLLETAEALPAPEQSAVLAPSGEDAELLAAVSELRLQGVRVVQTLEGEVVPGCCDRQLVQKDKQWVVEAR
ncbi:ATP phosphoribosyltransferase regulatory subunit [Marinobacterium zhoushanense]|uniref:ATP phosphoribosyltransferase regulatory subunit n=1 Tax=Marinobacterium zhoushanense TaxID=1679163 RepID=A0ABQ1KXC6_9GAMM|nr:ATP phosphoribosyltransferase regulatory subunit [Marinobacterium zhoushanense]GGC11579.1 ATP phosphoribosyltransferase regulatory subunit [Marinobacterium zhoushanense]